MAKCTPGFCEICGSILPNLKETGKVQCYSCPAEYNAETFGEMKQEYTIYFNRYEKTDKVADKSTDGDEEGPVIARICSKCGNNKMSYKTLQLRSADEGQTVFFSCTKCRHKETENS